MQTLVVRVLRFIATIIWIFFLVIFILVEVVIVVKTATGDYFQRDIPVHLRSVETLPTIKVNSDIVYFKHVIGADAKLKLEVKPTSRTVPVIFIGFSAIAFAILTVIFQARKILRSIRLNEPFDPRNIWRLRIISFSLLAIALLELLGSLFDRYLLLNYGGDALSHYVRPIDFGISTSIIAMIAFILSEIFRQGNVLKTENEAFV